jgi:glucose/arabinose dehydrogenase
MAPVRLPNVSMVRTAQEVEMRSFHVAAIAALSAVLSACYVMRPSEGGGQQAGPASGGRIADPADVLVPAGYRVEKVAEGLTFPTGVTFDESGRPYVVESGYSYGEVFTTPRLLRIERDGRKSVVVNGTNNGPWTGVAFAHGAFYVAEGGELQGGRILRVTPSGQVSAIVQGLPSFGDHHTDGPVVGPDGAIYFGQGTATNSGVVGPDNAMFGWLKRKPDFHDIPCKDIRLTGATFRSKDIAGTGEAVTGPFSAFGRVDGPVIKGSVPCSGAVMKVAPEGGALQLVAWGFRNPFGLAFSPDGQLYVADNAYDDRGSRPVWGAADLLWRVQPGTWYGWPDFSGERGVSDSHFKPPGKEKLEFILAEHPNKGQTPVAYFGVHSSSDGFDFSRNAAFGHPGEAFVAQFGDQSPAVGKVLAPVGFKVVRVDVRTGRIEDFAVNRGKGNGPATHQGTHGLERPVAARFDPSGTALYIVDFGVLKMEGQKAMPQTETGVLWRVVKEAR